MRLVLAVFLSFVALVSTEFAWGTATASYQIEGAWMEDGKGLSIWDLFSRTPGRIIPGEAPGDITDDFYHKYREDIQLIKQLGYKNFRISLSWPRLLPNGRKEVINDKAVTFYRNVLTELIANGITPWVTLYHWDLPLALEMELSGWRHPNISYLFADYADVCFNKFGDLVKHWITINEPWCVSVLGHNTGEHAPGRGRASQDPHIADGAQASREVYVVAHNLILSHARAVHVLRTKYAHQNAEIAITINPDFYYPKDPHDPRDVIAAQRALEFSVGHWIDPILFGDYPKSMRESVGSRLPRFTAEEMALVRGSMDYLGVNHYMSHLISHDVDPSLPQGWFADRAGTLSESSEWERTDMGWSIVPSGFHDVLVWIAKRYQAVFPCMPIVVTENGVAVAEPTTDAAVHDTKRIAYLDGYIKAMKKAIVDGANVQGYFLWSLLDNYEWAYGMSKKFGIVRVEPGSLRRVVKDSAQWYADLIKKEAKAKDGIILRNE